MEKVGLILIIICLYFIISQTIEFFNDKNRFGRPL